MKIRKPNCGIGLNYSVTDAERFISSLPDEFEIVPEGHVCVKWPDELTKARIEEVARCGGWQDCTNLLFRLAAIAPERKTRMVNLWKAPGCTAWEEDDPSTNKNYSLLGWRKVAGPIEIED